jgi:hypothetical protein
MMDPCVFYYSLKDENPGGFAPGFLFFIFLLAEGMQAGLLKQTSAGGFFLSWDWERWGCGNTIGLLRLCFKGPGLHPLRKQEHPDNKKWFSKIPADADGPFKLIIKNDGFGWERRESFGMRNCLQQVMHCYVVFQNFCTNCQY